MLLPMGAGDDGAHSQNEKINIRNYIEGVSYKAIHKFAFWKNLKMYDLFDLYLQLLFSTNYLLPTLKRWPLCKISKVVRDEQGLIS